MTTGLISFPWSIDYVTRRLGYSNTINTPWFTGAADRVGRRWRFFLVGRTQDGIELDSMPLYITVVDVTSLVVSSMSFPTLLVSRDGLTVERWCSGYRVSDL